MQEDNAESQGMEIPLAEMIQRLRQELVAAQAQAEDQRIRFELEKVELELKVVVARTGKGQVGIKFWVVSADGAYETAIPAQSVAASFLGIDGTLFERFDHRFWSDNGRIGLTPDTMSRCKSRPLVLWAYGAHDD